MTSPATTGGARPARRRRPRTSPRPTATPRPTTPHGNPPVAHVSRTSHAAHPVEDRLPAELRRGPPGGDALRRARAADRSGERPGLGRAHGGPTDPGGHLPRRAGRTRRPRPGRDGLRQDAGLRPADADPPREPAPRPPGDRQPARPGARPDPRAGRPGADRAGAARGGAGAQHAPSSFGGVGARPQITALRRGVDVLIACPGRLIDHVKTRNANLDAVDVCVLDEADHMADLGFLPGCASCSERSSPRRRSCCSPRPWTTRSGRWSTRT